MTIKSDRWIIEQAQHGMIEPFEAGQVRESARRQGHFLWHLELWLRCALRASVQGVYQYSFGHG